MPGLGAASASGATATASAVPAESRAAKTREANMTTPAGRSDNVVIPSWQLAGGPGKAPHTTFARLAQQVGSFCHRSRQRCQRPDRTTYWTVITCVPPPRVMGDLSGIDRCFG